MWKRDLKGLFCLLLSVLLWLAAGSTLRAETMHQVSDTDLTQLETSLKQLKTDSEKKQQLLTAQKQQLETANKQIAALKILNNRTQISLTAANQSLNELEREAKQKIKIKTRQRNLWIGAAGVLLYLYVKK